MGSNCFCSEQPSLHPFAVPLLREGSCQHVFLLSLATSQQRRGCLFEESLG